jgi:hypothetical protein
MQPIDPRATPPWLPPRHERRARHRLLRRAVVLALVLGIVGAGAIWTDAFGAGHKWQSLLERVDRLIAGPVPTRTPYVPTVVVTPAPTATAAPTVRPGSTPGPTASPRPTPARVAVDVTMDRDPKGHFSHEIEPTWCAPAGLTMVLALHNKVTASDDVQRGIEAQVHDYETYEDSHNGGWGPAAMVEYLAANGVPGYQLRAYETREDALRGSAVAIEETEAPVVLLAWRGAHTWVMTGFRADADPRIFADAEVTGTYILDPWYPDISSIWGPSDPPGTFQDEAEMVRNFLAWKRPEGKYPDRDGRFIVLIPTLPVDASA